MTAQARYMAQMPPVCAYMAPCPSDTYPHPWQPLPFQPLPNSAPTDVSTTIVINNNGKLTDAEHDLDELLTAVVALPPPLTESGMRLAATVAKLRERQRQRLGLPESAP